MRYLFFLLLSIILVSCNDKETQKPIKKPESIIIDYGLTFNDFKVVKDSIKKGDTFGTILEKFDLQNRNVFDIVAQVQDTFDVRKIQVDKKYYAFLNKKNKKTLEVLVYVQDRINYLVVDFRDTTQVVVMPKAKPTTIKRRTIAAELDGSLSETLDRAGVDAGLAVNLANIYAYSIDFFKTQKGDKFAVTIHEKYIDDSIYVGVDSLEAAYFEYKGKNIYAFPYQLKGKKIEYYDAEGKGLKNMFLKAPLDYFRISSRFSGKRFHPVQLRWKAHNGTDYAAPHGTPIKTTASGVVERTGYTSGNGNFVKVKHNGTYATQYLHMSKILVRKGQRVQQGQVIGRVGSTGLATGPHVCYRFWKNGVQVDPLRMKLPNTEPMDRSEINKYLAYIKPLKAELDNAKIKTTE